MPCPFIDDNSHDHLVVLKVWSEPRVVSSLHGTYGIICKRYTCNGCKKTFNGYDPRVIKKLPVVIQNQLPADVGNKTALDKDTGKIMSRQLVHKTSISDFRKLMEDMK